MKITFSKIYYLAVVYLLFPLFLLAQNTTGGNDGSGANVTGGNTGSNNPGTGVGSGRLENPLENQTLMGLLMDILDVIMVFAVPIIVFFIIYAGFLYVTAQGNEETVKKAHRALLYSVVGGVIILGAQLLLSVISGTIASF